MDVSFDRIRHEELLKKINAGPTIRRQIKAWLRAGVMDGTQLFPTKEGTMQGGPLSPLLANVALHGLEEAVAKHFRADWKRRFTPPIVVRYCDDLVVLHDERKVIEQCGEIISQQLEPMGLRLKPSKTRITHSLRKADGEPGFDFLGFNIRQYPAGRYRTGKNPVGEPLGFKTIIKPSATAIRKHTQKLRKIVHDHTWVGQGLLITALNPVIIGWTNYYARVVSKQVFIKLEHELLWRLMAWARRRHPNKNRDWIVHKYWQFSGGKRWVFQSPGGGIQLYPHHQTPIKRHVKVQGRRSTYDGDWIYWSTRLGRHPEVSPRVATLLKRQQGKCRECGLFFADGDVMEVDHLIPRQWGGSDALHNCQLLHRHCHDVKTARDEHEWLEV